MGAGAIGVTLCFASFTISPLRQDDQDTNFAGYHDEFQYSKYSPFNVQEESDDDAPITKGKFKAVNEKLDNLLESSKTSSRIEYSFESIKALIETLTKEHTNSPVASTKVVENLESTVREMTEKVEKLLANVTHFMEEFQSSSENNIATANKVITNIGYILQSEKEALYKVHSDLQVDNTKMNAFVVSKIEKLQVDLAIENALMDKLVVKTEKVKVLPVNLSHAKTQIDELKSERDVMKSGVADESGSHPKQGGEVKKPAGGSDENETMKYPPKTKDLKGNNALGSKGKGKLIDDDKEEEYLSEEA
ncbi:unnamed protein product [Lactuca saligna]|uniref:Uncharacterized protein n=1 Tax=Lactuca saligna TaxID=75948 RepID=A0AA35YIR2_LACSI|nr:unnamed protein product [Lactuca saligna]